MKSTELRIGNWVLASYNNKDYKVIEVIDVLGYGINQHYDDVEYNFEDEDVKPIPLTKERLLKFGFEYSSSYETYCKGDYCIHIKDGEFHFMNDSCSNAGCYYLTTIKYVHQLQNLYHALGEELTIK